MTTIAVDVLNKKIASDSKVTWGGPAYSTLKIFRSANGTICAFAGNLSAGKKFAEWVEQGCNRKKPPQFTDSESFSGVTINADKVETWDEDMIPSEIVDDPFFVMGSGGAFALAALHCGKTLEEAVELAIKLDMEGSGGKVRSMEYERSVRQRKPKKSV